MNISYLAVNWGERISTAWVVALQGMLTIFLVLSILWLVIDIMHRIIHKDENKVKPEKISSRAFSFSFVDLIAAGNGALAVLFLGLVVHFDATSDNKRL